jgi:hypothetical protein
MLLYFPTNVAHYHLHNAYSLEGLAYRKIGSQIQRTVEALDYADMYLNHKAKFPDFAVFMRVIDQFFSSVSQD